MNYINREPSSELTVEVLKLSPYFKRSAFFGLIASLLVLAPTFYMFEVYDRVVNSRNHMTLVMLTLLVVLAYIVMEVLEWVRSKIMLEAAEKFDTRMAPRVFQVIYDAGLKRMGVGIQPMNDFRTVRDFLPSAVLGVIMQAPAALIFLLMVFMLHPAKGVVTLVMGVLIGIVGWLNERKTNPPLTEANRSAIASQKYADATLRNSQVIESMGMIRDIHRRWHDKHREFLRFQMVASDHAGTYQAISKFLQVLMGSMLLGLGAWLTLMGLLDRGGGAIILGSMLGGRVIAPFVQIVTQWRVVIQARDAWGRLDQVLSQLPPKLSNMPLPAPKGRLTIENVVAGAPGTQSAILKGVTLALEPGEVLAVIGPSASGKTTLARLLVGLWPTSAGKVRLDGVDVHAWDKQELGVHLGYLPQGVELLEGTLAENIARFGKISQDRVEAAAKAVGLHEFILALPQGYDSPVGPEGAMLSGGQRQRVALARAIYGDPVLIVLDEPNSSLDEVGDKALVQTIRDLKARGSTFVVMTHRTNVLAVADKMLVLRDGAQQMFGSRDEVLKTINQAMSSTKVAQQPKAKQQAAPSGTAAR